MTAADLKNHVAVFAFDLLYLNNEPLLVKTLEQRRQILKSTLSECQGKLYFAQSSDINEFDELEDFLNKSIKDGCEGLMVKTLKVNSSYEPSKRSFNWLKLKKDYLDDLGDSMDLVVVGADYGTGKRTGWFSSFLLACYNEQTGKFQTICKCGSGFTDEQYNSLKAKMGRLVIDKPHPDVQFKEVWNNSVKENAVVCDVYFEPMFVWEIKAADLSLSPMHSAGLGAVDIAHSDKGVALRFNRHIRDRPDKKPTEATTSD